MMRLDGHFFTCGFKERDEAALLSCMTAPLWCCVAHTICLDSDLLFVSWRLVSETYVNTATLTISDV